MKSPMNRREFLTRTATAALAVGAARRGDAGQAGRDLPRRMLGKTGVQVSALTFGGGSHFLSRVGGDRPTVEKLIHRALELGITSFDTAATYTFPPHQRLSETYYGEILGPRRKDIFLSTKARERDRDGILRSVEISLRLLRTDHIDLLQMHSLQQLTELDAIGAPNGALAALRRLQGEGVIRFIGITGHYDPAVLVEAVRRFDVDTILMSLNAAQASHPLSMTPDRPLAGFETDVLPAAVAKKMGVVAMKVLGQGNLLTAPARATPQELIRYALSLPVDSVEISHTSLPILEENVAAARNFQPMDAAEMGELRRRLAGPNPR